MIVREIRVRTILSDSRIYDYAINPYVGCQHGCSYCYARFMKRFSGHREEWGNFVDVKVNSSELLPSELRKKKPARVWISGVCDPYQPAEKKYRLTRKCLEILFSHGWPVSIQTRSPLILEDLDILSGATDLEAGFSVTTADDNIRRIFEPHAPAISERINALEILHKAGIRTYAMIAPLLPGADGLAGMLTGKVDYVMIDRMNYNHSDWVYRKFRMEGMKTDGYFRETASRLGRELLNSGISYNIVF